MTKDWNEVAAGWAAAAGEMDEAYDSINLEMIALAGLQPGQRVLDVATGPGNPAIHAAMHVGPAGHVLATDRFEQMLEVARKRAADLKLQNIEFKVADGTSLDFEAEPFDAILCRWGLPFFGDVEASVKAVRRHLVKGGVYVSLLWAAQQKTPLLGLPDEIIRRELGLPTEGPGPTPIFSLSDPTPALEALDAAGFADKRLETVAFTIPFESGEHFASHLQEVSMPLIRLVSGETEERQKEIWDKVASAANERFRGQDGRVQLPNETHVLVARA
jgi:SAM-dependent methyltransferase